MDHKFKVNIIDAFKKSLFLKNFIGETEEENSDVIIFLLAFILFLKKNNLQMVPFEFELILNQPQLNKFDTQDWEGFLLKALDMHKCDKVVEDIPQEAIHFGQKLTLTEMIIALLICEDLTDQEIADKIFKKCNCIRKHHTNINIKFGTHRPLGVYKVMLAMGLILPPKPIAA